MVISPHTRCNVQYCEFMVQGKPMEFVSSYVHLGHLISDKLDDGCDISQRRCDFIGQVNNVLCYFQTELRHNVKQFRHVQQKEQWA